jgi:hypothetical protein
MIRRGGGDGTAAGKSPGSGGAATGGANPEHQTDPGSQDRMKDTPMLDWAHTTNHHPHVVILGAGASRAACLGGDANGKTLPLTNDLVRILGLEELLLKHGYDPAVNFELTYSSMYGSPEADEARVELERRVRGFFSDLVLPASPTFYDYLVLGLRGKDLIATFNWDPLLFQAYGRNEHVGPLPKWHVLHGNVCIGVCYQDKRKGNVKSRCDSCKKPFTPMPLLFPIREKDYASNPLIKNEWEAAAHQMRYGYWLTIVGYRAPDSDAEAMRLLSEPWQENKWRSLAEIEIVDIRPRDEVEATWRSFFVRNHYSVFEDWRHLEILRYPRRSCEALFAQSQMNDPWKENPMPLGTDLATLQESIAPLLEEERAARDEGGSLSSHGRRL